MLKLLIGCDALKNILIITIIFIIVSLNGFVNANELTSATFNRVVDGDTIEITLDNKRETVRLLLVDTPETKHPKLKAQPLGKEATEFTKKFFTKKDIKIEYDKQQRDKYKRLLAYVYVDDKMLNRALIEAGFARVYGIKPNTKYLKQFKSIEEQMRIKGVGIWGIKGYVTSKGFQLSVR